MKRPQRVYRRQLEAKVEVLRPDHVSRPAGGVLDDEIESATLEHRAGAEGFSRAAQLLDKKAHSGGNVGRWEADMVENHDVSPVVKATE
jgi:hypothetical protein